MNGELPEYACFNEMQEFAPELLPFILFDKLQKVPLSVLFQRREFLLPAFLAKLKVDF